MGVICSILAAGASLALTAALVPRPAYAAPNEAIPLLSVVKVGPNGRLVRVLRGKTSSEAHSPHTRRNYTVAAESDIVQFVNDAAKRYQVDPLLVHSVIRVESNFNPAALSPKGARGLMQLIPSTAQRFGVIDPFDPKQNIEGGVRYLKYLQDRFPHDLTLSIAAYNAGEGAVTKYQTVPPYPETLGYVAKVSRGYSGLLAEQAPPPAASQIVNIATAASPEEPVNHIQQVRDAEGRLYLRTR